MSVHQLPIRRHAATTAASDVVAPSVRRKWVDGRMYAICFDLDTKIASQQHPTGSDTAAYGLIERVFSSYGFSRQQGSVFFGQKDTTSVHCVLAVQDLVRQHPWMRFAIKDIRMLRVEEENDLSPALGGQSDLPLGDAAGI